MSTRKSSKASEIKRVVNGAFIEVRYPIPPDLWEGISSQEVLGMDRPTFFETLQKKGVPRAKAAKIVEIVIPNKRGHKKKLERG